VKKHIRVENFERKDESKRSDKLRVQTRYIKLLVHATWLEDVEDMPVDGNPVVSAHSYHSSHSVTTWSNTTVEMLPTVEPSRASHAELPSLYKIPVFKILDGHFAWLHEEDIAHYSKPAGQVELHEWLSDIPSLLVDSDLGVQRPSQHSSC
jgi:hypothetical protein